jgi:nucleotide-binding universal stress UspA family protein
LPFAGAAVIPWPAKFPHKDALNFFVHLQNDAAAIGWIPRRNMNVLIGYDGSQYADWAIEELLWAGIPEGSRVVILTAAPVWLEPTDELGGATITEAAFRDMQAHSEMALARSREMAEEAVKKFRPRFPQYKFEADAIADTPAWAIIQRAESWPADLIIVGSHGRSALGRLVLGSVSHRVVTHARCAVRIARKHREVSDGGLRLLLGTDGSSDAAAAIDTILSRRWPTNTTVRVLSATGLDIAAGAGNWMIPPPPNWGDWAKRAADLAAQSLNDAKIQAEAIVSMSDPKAALLAAAQQWPADCIFLGASGMTGIERFLLGSVSTAVAMHAPCSVEIAHHSPAATA